MDLRLLRWVGWNSRRRAVRRRRGEGGRCVRRRASSSAHHWAGSRPGRSSGRRCWRQLRQVSQPDSAGVRGDLVGLVVAVVASVVGGRLRCGEVGDSRGPWSPPARPGPPIGSSSGVGNASLLRELSVPRARLPRRAPHRCSCWVRGIRGACQLLKRLASLGCMILSGLDFCRLIQILSASDRGGILGCVYGRLGWEIFGCSACDGS